MTEATLFEPADRWADLSECESYRYTLGRRWDDGPLLGFVMLNPSTADALQDDPTIRRCVGFARREGLAGIEVVNLFAYRTPKPAALIAASRAGTDVVGPDNDAAITRMAQDRFGVRAVVLAWGAGGPRSQHWTRTLQDRIAQVRDLVGPRRLCRFAPGYGAVPAPHPLFLPADTPIEGLS